MSQHNTWELRIEGSIQGVGFRPFVYRLAQEEQVKGEVQNKGNFVRIIIQGPEKRLKSFSLNLKLKKPPLAVIDKIIKTVIHTSPTYNTFSIIKSKLESKILSPSYIPPDISICNQCLEDMLTGDRAERKHYSFTSCVDCGPRFSVIKGIPYDRPQTTMDAFPLCSKCMKEYTDPTDRRFHAQTTCCRTCGPQYYLSNRSGITLETIESRVITNSQKLLLEGNILAIKGIGGTHLACRVDDFDIIEELRSRKGDRKRKPFALMSLSIDQINQFSHIPNENTVNLLNSPRRPIVLLPKRDDFTLAQNIAPNLHNIGVMLPYSGFHYLLLDHPKLKTLVMTSANRSHLPIQIDNREILRSLKDVADYFILHDREIHQRNDDSVVKPYIFTQNHQTTNLFLRRSRGQTPEPLDCPIYNDSSLILGLGAELHTTASLISQGKLFLTQYIGNLRYEPTYRFYQDAIHHMQNLLQNPPLAAIAHDLHPLYLSTEYAKDLKTKTNVPSVAFQHHYAHGASLLADNGLWDEEAVIAVADGLGYGIDGNVWGGEILQFSFQDYTRAGHIEYVIQPGGDLATKFPYRMLLSYLESAGVPEEEILNIVSGSSMISPGLAYSDARIILQQIEKKFNSPLTSSTGRFLDACSAALGFCVEATYEGEPAIVLEGQGWAARHTTDPNPFIKESLKEDLGLNFGPIVHKLLELISKRGSKSELAWHIQEFVGWSFAQAIISQIQLEGIQMAGFSGGVAYNDLITYSLINTLQKSGLRLKGILLHKNLPPGDGGISAGQAVLLASRNIV